MTTPSWKARFEKYYRKGATEQDCWLWIGAKTQAGYGQFAATGKRTTSAHRVAYELYKGEIPEGLDVHHECEVRNCVNPAHLEAITHRENLARSEKTQYVINKQKTHCPRGHEYNEKNTYLSKRGWRQCRPCNAERARERRQANRMQPRSH